MKKFMIETSDSLPERFFSYAKIAPKVFDAVFDRERIVLISDFGLPVAYMHLADKFRLWDAYGREMPELAGEFCGTIGTPDVLTLLLYICTFVNVVDYKTFFDATDEDDGFDFFDSYSLSVKIRQYQHAARIVFDGKGMLPHPFTFEDSVHPHI